MLRIIPVAGLAVTSNAGFEELARRLSTIENTGAWVQVVSSWDVLLDEGVGEVVDAFYDYNLNLASLKFEYTSGFNADGFEKIALIADESAGRTVIIAKPGWIPEEDFEQIYDVAATYKVKVLLEPSSMEECKRVYDLIKRFIGGVLGLSLTEEDYPSTEYFTGVLKNYLQITKNLNISNYENGRPAPLLIPSDYNNPKLLRFLLKQNFEGFLTLFYGKSSVDDLWLFKQLLTIREHLASLEEKED
ncbi:hypothetical protein IG193_03720 [Infirmifilum lucidum]|uniref:Uncharacterized protein n=1 Tax=Infirmifilum lucidum TaxID=2776706 RepID=A0A7L9FL35_9CREN|nr:hypothetical protein [Infirmifilum lucidum]QOJ79576.1 hypothetical protein IG193_03720 [Infirmifilum lucidum]